MADTDGDGLSDGYEVNTSGSDPKAVDVVRNKTPQAILIDVESPQATGWDVLKTLKADCATQDVPIVICSWLDEKARSLQAGAVAHLRKPVMYDDVSAALTEAGVQASVHPGEQPAADVG